VMLRLPVARKLQRSGDIKICGHESGLADMNYLGALKQKKVIYTAIFGGKDNIPALKYVPKDWDLVIFTDNESLDSKTWQVVFVEPSNRDPTRAARELKLSPHKLFPNHTISAWIDANLNMTCDINTYFDRFIKDNDFVLLRHWQDVTGPYHEVQRCIDLKKDDEAILKRQGTEYRAAGMPSGLEVAWTAILIRRHNLPHVKAFDEMWLQELHKYSKRDQISFPYCAWKTGLKYATIPGLGQYFRRMNHRRGGWK
ncbi:MAG: DUF616 domain-containing protein, partial [Gammaproteobacteria bacterium]|nr:DUF616 domain-containing protein [Gammaproteobacteria bacterium]